MILRFIMLLCSSFGLIFIATVLIAAVLISGYDQKFTGIIAKVFGSIRGFFSDVGINIPNLGTIDLEKSDLLQKIKDGASQVDFKGNGS